MSRESTVNHSKSPIDPSKKPDASSEATEGREDAGLSQITDQLVYTPTDAQKRLKARFWSRINGNPLYSGQITLAAVRDVLGTEALNQVWNRPGFQDWFLNQGETRERLEYLFTRALDAAEQILMNEDPKAQAARVNIIKVLADLAGKFPRQAVDESRSLATTVGKMDKAQLEMMLEKNGIKMTVSASKGVADDSIVDV